MTTMILKSGSVIEKGEFGQIFGGGRKKANETPFKVQFSFGHIFVCKSDTADLVELIEHQHRENLLLRVQCGIPEEVDLRNFRPRIRVKANSAPVTPVLVASTLAPVAKKTRRKAVSMRGMTEFERKTYIRDQIRLEEETRAALHKERKAA